MTAACAKKKAKKNIVGSWNEVKIDNLDVPLGAQDIINFQECDGGDCIVNITDAGGAVSTSFYYELEDGGETLVLITVAGIFTAKNRYTINEISDSKMVIDWNTYIGEYSKN